MITVSTYIGGIFAFSMITPPSFENNNAIGSNVENDLTTNAIPQNYTRRGILAIEACECLGVTYSDTDAPPIRLISPTNNSIMLGGTTIELHIKDNYPLGDKPFGPKQVLYHWDTEQSNTSLSHPEAEDDFIYNVTLLNDEGAHVLYVYAVDYEGNWASSIFVFTVTSNPSSVTQPPPETTFSTEPQVSRRSPGFLLPLVISALIGSVTLITWRKRK